MRAAPETTNSSGTGRDELPLIRGARSEKIVDNKHGPAGARPYRFGAIFGGGTAQTDTPYPEQ
jgi:hypothetical protein